MGLVSTIAVPTAQASPGMSCYWFIWEPTRMNWAFNCFMFAEDYEYDGQGVCLIVPPVKKSDEKILIKQVDYGYDAMYAATYDATETRMRDSVGLLQTVFLMGAMSDIDFVTNNTTGHVYVRI